MVAGRSLVGFVDKVVLMGCSWDSLDGVEQQQNKNYETKNQFIPNGLSK